MKRMPYAQWVEKAFALLQECRDAGEPDKFAVVRLEGVDEAGDPVYADSDAIDDVESKKPGTYQLIRKGGEVIAECIIREAGAGRLERVRSIDPHLALGRNLAAVGDSWHQHASYLQSEVERLREREEKLQARLDKSLEENRALAAQLQSPMTDIQGMIALASHAIQVWQGSKDHDAIVRALPKLLPLMGEDAKAQLVAALNKAESEKGTGLAS